MNAGAYWRRLPLWWNANRRAAVPVSRGTSDPLPLALRGRQTGMDGWWRIGHDVGTPPTCTNLFSDIEGSTRLLQRLGDSYRDVLHVHHALLREAFGRYGGIEVGTTGDGFFVAFRRAADGVAAAVAGQLALTSHPWPADATVRVRMGLHTGEPSPDSGDYIGYDVHRAARISSSAHGGQVVVSEVTRRLAEGTVGAVGFVDLGEHRLRDLGEPEHLYQVSAEGLPAQFPPLRSLGAARTNLPGQLTSFVGREQDVAQLEDLVVRHRLLTLTGPGGAGKTRLALRTAGGLLHCFPDGVWMVRLAPVADPDLVAYTIAVTIGLREAGSHPPLEVIADYSRGKRLLLLLDNFEHLMAAAGVVGELVEQAPGVSVLVTSREVLNLRGEREMMIPALALPQRHEPVDPVQLRQVESVRLFVDRARNVVRGFDVTEDNAAALVEIAYRLEGLPLAIELAAARVKVLSPQALLARLDDRLRLLTGGSRDLPERQRTLRATIEWSYGLLGEEERTLLGRLSVFSGAVRLETVEAVCDWDGSDVLTVLAALVDKSLVRRAGSGSDDVSFWMLATVKEFAQEKLRERGEVEQIRNRHTEYYRGVAQRFRDEVFGRCQVDLLDRVESEQADVHAAIQCCLEFDAVDWAADISEGIHAFWLIRGHYGAGRYWLRRVTAEGVTDPVLHARVLVANARLATDQGAFDEAEEALGQAVAVGRRHGDDLVVAQAVSELTWVRIQRGDEQADELAERSLETFRRLGDVSGEAELLLRVGGLMVGRAHFTEAMQTYAQALSLMRRAGNSWGAAIALNNIGYLAALEERFDDAMPYLVESRELFEKVRTKEGLAGVTDSLALVAAGRGDSAEAVALYETSMELFRDMDNRAQVAIEQVHLGRTRAERGESEQAAACLLDGLQVSADVGDLGLRAYAFEAIAALLLRADRLDQAAALYAAAGRFREAEGLTLAPVDARRLQRDLTLLEDRMAPASLADAYARGARMTRHELHAAALAAVQHLSLTTAAAST